MYFPTQNFLTKIISCKYNVGGYCTFTSSWQGKNIVLPDAKLYFILDGEIFLEINGERLIATKGDLILIPANTVHSCGLTEIKYMKKAWCHFSMMRGKNNFFENLSFPFLIKVEDMPRIEQIFDKLFRAQEKVYYEKDSISSACICEIVSYYLASCTVKEKAPAEDRIDICIKYMQENYAENPDVETLAKMANYSLNHFIKRFKAKTGLTPSKYLTALKIDAARSLLQHSRDSINTVMAKTGFFDTSHFIKSFKKRIGYTPKKFSELYRI